MFVPSTAQDMHLEGCHTFCEQQRLIADCELIGFILSVYCTWSTSQKHAYIISASNGNCEAVPWTAERFGVQTHYYRLTMWSVMCVTKNGMIQQTLGWFSAFPDLAETIDTAAMPKKATLQLITPSIPIARGLIMRLMTSAYKICDRGHFEFCLNFEFYFYPFSVYLQAMHDSSCAYVILWCRFLDNT